jgi:hypothetical protein
MTFSRSVPPNGIAIAVIFLFDKPGLLGTYNDENLQSAKNQSILVISPF